MKSWLNGLLVAATALTSIALRPLQVQAEEHLDQRGQQVHLVRQEVLVQQDLQDQQVQQEVLVPRDPQVRKVRQELLAQPEHLEFLKPFMDR